VPFHQGRPHPCQEADLSLSFLPLLSLSVTGPWRSPRGLMSPRAPLHGALRVHARSLPVIDKDEVRASPPVVYLWPSTPSAISRPGSCLLSEVVQCIAEKPGDGEARCLLANSFRLETRKLPSQSQGRQNPDITRRRARRWIVWWRKAVSSWFSTRACTTSERCSHSILVEHRCAPLSLPPGCTVRHSTSKLSEFCAV